MVLRAVYDGVVSQSPFIEIDHVQLAMPPDGEEAARHFFCDVLGMNEIAKPLELAGEAGAGSRAEKSRCT